MPAPDLTLSSSCRPLVGRNLVKTYGDRVVLDELDLVASPGVPLGVVGENGAGKSTLLRLLAGVEDPDTGEVERPPGLRYLPQEPDFPAGWTVGDVLDRALAPMHEAARRLEELAAGCDASDGAAREYADHLDACVARDVWGADRRTEEAAHELGLDGLHRERAVGSLSGGQRSRLALATLVAQRPVCLLLDEPTNHLDDPALEYLEALLGALPGVVIAASHDRTFLDNVCRVLVDLDPSDPSSVPGSSIGRSSLSRPVAGVRFTGGYADFLATKAEARRRWNQDYAAQRDEVSALRSAAVTTARRVAPNRPPRDNDKFIHHTKGQNVERTVSRRVRDVERRLAALERDAVPKPPTPLRLAVPAASAPARGRIVVVRDLLVVGRLQVPHLDVHTSEPLLVSGHNGSGKSTLLRVLAGALSPDAGSMQVSARRVGLLPQDVTFVRPKRSARQVYARLTEGALPLTDLGLLHPRDLDQPVGRLSLGQQRRLALAIVLARRPDLLLLDEPTNHISLTLAEELEEALQSSPQAVVVATHDRWLRSRWSGTVHAM
jgi:macrolide transport system ATP-binding/permease protein